MYICSSCKRKVLVKEIKKRRGYCEQCESFSVDLTLSMHTKKYLDKERNESG